MQKYKSNLTSVSGAAVRGASITVLDDSGATASIFLDRAGTLPAGNPLKTAQDGTFEFYAANGRYSLRTDSSGLNVLEEDVIMLFDPDDGAEVGPIADAAASLGDIQTSADLAATAQWAQVPSVVNKLPGATDPLNEQAQQLTNRTQYLFDRQRFISDFRRDGEDDTEAVRRALQEAASVGFSVHIGDKKWVLEDAIAFSGGMSLIGFGPNISVFRQISENAKLSQSLASVNDRVSYSGMSFESEVAPSITVTGLQIDGRPTMSGGRIPSRENNKGAFENLAFYGKSGGGHGVGLDLISFGWFSANHIHAIGKLGVPASEYILRGILIRGPGTPVEMNFSNVWGYSQLFGIQAPDYTEGINISKFNFVNAINAISLGANDSDVSLHTSHASLAPVIYGGHANCARGINCSGTNEAKISDLLIYINDRGVVPDSYGMRFINGARNNTDGVTVVNTSTNGGVVRTGLIASGVTSSKFDGTNVSSNTASFIDKAIDIGSTSSDNIIDSTQTDTCTVGVYLGASTLRNNVGTVVSKNTATKIQNLSSSNYIKPLVLTIPSSVYSFAGETFKDIDIPLPAGVFTAKPTDVTVSTQSGTTLFNFVYQFDASTTSLAKVRVIPGSGTNLPTGNFRIGATVIGN